jgi:hypothetical protein
MLLRRFSLPRNGSRGPAALPDDLLGGLVHHGEHTADPARQGFIWDRAVGKGLVGLLKAVIADDLELYVPSLQATLRSRRLAVFRSRERPARPFCVR